jgi:hypothetical protein
MAERTVADAFSRFDALFAQIQPGEVKKMNEAIAILTAAQSALMDVGNKDTNKGNELAQGFNDRMKKVDDLSKVPAPKPQPKPVQQVQQQLPPKSQSSPKMPAYEVEVEALPAPPPAQSQSEEPIPADIEASLAQFDSIERKVAAITKMDVWTGNANATVNEWNDWQNKYAQRFVNLVAQKGPRNARLRDYGDKYNRLGTNLSDKITNFQLTSAQKDILNRVQSEYESIVSEFRATFSDAALKKLEALDRSIRALGIPDHPSVVGALQSFDHSLNQMRSMVKR